MYKLINLSIAKNIIVTGLLKLLLPAVLSIISISAIAQKLPNVQENSMRAPANIKVDGRAVEWDDQFQAKNKSTNVFYTISNDDKMLYLILQATDDNTITKMVLGGVTITINGSGKMKDKDGVAIRFPAYEKMESPFYLNLTNKPEITNDVTKNRIQADSFINARNKQLIDRLKTIEITGAKGIEDSLLSIYNQEGIQAVARLNSKIYYTYELAVPLKYLGISIDKKEKFSYNIKLNGSLKSVKNVKTVATRHGDMLIYTGNDGTDYTLGLATPENMNLTYPTDFWGEYILKR